jgi:transposase
MTKSLETRDFRPVAQRRTAGNVYIGVDISKARLDVAVWPDQNHCIFENNKSGVRQFITYTRALGATLVALEHAGRLSRDLTDSLFSEQIPVALVDPRKVRAFATVLGKEAKTDRLDAVLIAHFCAIVEPQEARIITAKERELQDLVNRRFQIISDRRREGNRLVTSSDLFCVDSVSRHLQWLDREADAVSNEISERIKSNEEWSRRCQLLMSMPGVGPVLAQTLVSQLPELGYCDSRRIASLIGLAPIARDSGEVRRRRRTGFGRTQVRAALYMSSIVATRHNSTIRRFHQRLLNAGKPRMVARFAVMRKMITIMNAMVRDKVRWSDSGM